MLDILRFIFSDFWIWFGTLVMITAILQGVAAIINALPWVRSHV